VGVEIYLHTFLTSALKGVNDQLHATAASFQGEEFPASHTKFIFVPFLRHCIPTHGKFQLGLLQCMAVRIF
jgi:hypothetical protein